MPEKTRPEEGVGRGTGDSFKQEVRKGLPVCLNITGLKAVGEEHLAAGAVGAKALGQDLAGLLEVCVAGAG